MTDDNYPWDPVTENDPFIVTIAGPPGYGKTHMALTMNEVGPVYFCDTETRGAYLLRTKFKSKNIWYKKADTWTEMQRFLRHVYSLPVGTVVIDSGSDYGQYAEREHLKENRLEKVWPQVLWAEVYEMMERPLRSLKARGFNIVITSRVKEEYIGGETTGNLVPRLYHAIPYISDAILQFDLGENTLSVKKNSWQRAETWPTTRINREQTLPELVEQLQQVEWCPTLIGGNQKNGNQK